RRNRHRGRRSPAPSAERLRRQRHGFRRRDVADDDQRGGTRLPVSVVESSQVFACEALYGGWQALDRTPVRMIRSEREYRTDSSPDRGRALLLLRERVEVTLLLAVELGSRIRGVLDDVAENRHRGVEVSLEDLERDPCTLPRGGAGERDAQIAERVLDL